MSIAECQCMCCLARKSSPSFNLSFGNNTAEGTRLIKGGRKAALEETLTRLKALKKVESFSDSKKLQKLKELLEQDIRSYE